jgi:hypothetical protein
MEHIRVPALGKPEIRNPRAEIRKNSKPRNTQNTRNSTTDAHGLTRIKAATPASKLQKRPHAKTAKERKEGDTDCINFNRRRQREQRRAESVGF